MQYYQSKNGNVVLAVDSVVYATTMTPVIVIPVAQWRRLVAIVPTEGGHSVSLREAREIDAIITSVEVPHD